MVTPLSANKTRYVRFCIDVPNQPEASPEKVFITFEIDGESYKFSLAE